LILVHIEHKCEQPLKATVMVVSISNEKKHCQKTLTHLRKTRCHVER